MKSNFNRISALIVLGLTISVVSAQEKPVPADAFNVSANVSDANEKRGFLLGVGDELEIKVLGEPDYDGVYAIDEDGKIEVPFAETPITASCKTDRELRTEIVELLKKDLRDPRVNVRVTKMTSRPTAVVYGEVRMAQQFDMRRSVNLRELISFTGGETDKASGMIQIYRAPSNACGDVDGVNAAQTVPKADGETALLISLKDLKSGKPEANPMIRPGDVINVLKAAPIYVIGEVLVPDEHDIPQNGMTLTDAVAMSRGLTPRAKKKDVRIYRLKPNSSEREMISANLDLIKKGQQENIVLQPFDIVEVEKAPKSFLQVVSEIALGTARQVQTVLPATIIR